ncbi:MAG: cation:proton antiporter [Planctomycetes bacterium]|nr:cation:proton antiporter [Planctomycetota bacterium]
MTDAAVLLILGMLFLLGLVSDFVGRRTFLPRVTMLLITGIVIGPSGLGAVPDEFVATWFPLLTDIALGMIGFLLGEKFRLSAIRRRGRVVVGLSIGKVLGAAATVLVVMLLSGVDLPVALLFAGIAPATAPAATFDVVRETGAEGEFPDTLLSVAAVDDAWGLLLFSLLMAAAAAVLGHGGLGGGILAGVGEIAGSLALGLAIGVPMAFLTGRIRPGEPTLAEALGMVMVCSGAALWFGLSPILATMALGSVVASLARHHRRPFHAIENVEWPFLIMFFMLAGASLEFSHLRELGWIGVVYIVGRVIGINLGIRLGGAAIGAAPVLRRWLGLALLPQAGVAIGMALLASQRFPALGEQILPIVLASTVVFELSAPIITRRVLKVVGERG